MASLRYAIAVFVLVSASLAQNSAPVASDNPSQPTANSQEPVKPSIPAESPAVPPDSTSLIAIKTVKAVYPAAAAGLKLQEQVVVKITVSETGDVESAEVVSGNPVLATAAVDAVKKWKFRPFIRNGKPVKASVKLPFDFAFSDEVSDISPKMVSARDATGASAVVQVPQGVIQGMLIHKVQPTYPPQALRALIEGTVVLAAIISKEGTIKELRVVSGPHALIDAAKGAVQQWRYRPYVLNGEPVEVGTRITVNFSLSGG